jgi:GntR family transcriptional regulator
MADPMYRQIAEDLRQKIESGALGPGAQLPTELELREQHNNASRNTVRDAVKWLITRGLVETKPGQGTFVIEKINPYVNVLTAEADASAGDGDIYRQEVSATLRHPAATPPRVEIQQAAGIVASELQLHNGAPVVSRHQQRSIDGTPWSLQTSFYPMSLVSRGAQRLIEAPDISEGVVAYLGAELGLKQVGYRDMILVRAPDGNETTFFRLPSDGRVVVFEVSRTAFDEQRKPFRLTVSVYPADRNQLAVRVGDVPGDISRMSVPGSGEQEPP